jgi:hypothetical protein
MLHGSSAVRFANQPRLRLAARTPPTPIPRFGKKPILRHAQSRWLNVNITKSLFATAALLGLSFVSVPAAFADPVETIRTTTTTTDGTVSEFGRDRIVIHSEASRKPIGYTFTKTTTYVDENGAPVSVETVKSGLPVTVYYTQDGDRMVASKVVVRRARERDGGAVVEKRTTTTRDNTLGTVSEFGADSFEIKSDTSPTPVRYLYSTKTTYVDENGAPVSVETVKSGLPVTVYYTREGDRMNATKVIVRRAAAAPGAIVTKKTTTVTEEKK